MTTPMSEPDWADDVARGLDGVAANFRRPEETRANVAAALRKAKADGMREAAKLIESNETLPVPIDGNTHTYLMAWGDGIDAAAEVILTRAAAIEAGED